MTKKRKKGSVPRPKGRGTVHKGKLQRQPYAAPLLAVLQRLKLKARPYVAQCRTLPGHITLYLRRHWTVVKACLIFAGCILVFMLTHSWMVSHEKLGGLLTFTAAATGFMLNLSGNSVQVNGGLISSPDFSMGIVSGCTGIIPTVILVSAVLAYPCQAKQKATGIALGIAAIFVLNLLRTVSLFLIGSRFSSSFFNTAHFLIWQPIMIMLAIVLWLFWVEKLVRVTTH